MSLSGTYTFGISTEAVDLIEEAFERATIKPSDISAEMLISARRSLGFMATSWSNRGPNLWTTFKHTITLVASDPDYTLPAQTIHVLEAYTRQDGRDQMIGPMSRSEYASINDKAQEAPRPTQFYLQRTSTPVLFVWPVPDGTIATTLILNIMGISQDIGKMSNQIDAPQRAFDAIAADLAYRIAMKWKPERADPLKIDRDEAYEYFSSEDRERVPLRIMPDVQDVLS